MPELLRRGTPPPPALTPRCPERQRLADAIQQLAEGLASAERVAEARHRIDNKLYDELQPAVTAAKQALEEAADASPELLVDAVLSGGIAEDATAVARITLRQAEAAVEQAQQARAMLRDEAARAEIAVTSAHHALDNAVSAAVTSGPARAALIAEYDRAARRVLDCAQALKTLGVNQIAEAHGLRLIVAIAPAAMGQTAFKPDPEWLSAIAALRDDADAPLPDPPLAEDGDAKAA